MILINSSPYIVEYWVIPKKPSQGQLSELVECILQGKSIDQFPKIPLIPKGSVCPLLWTSYKIQEFIDVRGIDLSWKSIGEYDLSYCCFDEANLQDVSMTATWIQFSTFKGTQFDRSILIDIQWSPIYAPDASFKDASINGWYYMESFFRGANMEWVKYINNPVFDCSVLS